MKVLGYHTRLSGGKAPHAVEVLARQTAIELKGHYAGIFCDTEDAENEFVDRPGAKALLDRAARGDCIVVPGLEDLGHSAAAIQKALEALRDRGLGLRPCSAGTEQCLDPDRTLAVALDAARLYRDVEEQQRQARRERRLARNGCLRQLGLPVCGQRRWGERRIWIAAENGRRWIKWRELCQDELDMLRHVWGRWHRGEKIQTMWRERKWRNAEGRRLSYCQLWRGVRWFDRQIQLGVMPGDYASAACAEAAMQRARS